MAEAPKPRALPLAILIPPRWGLPGAVPQAILISHQRGFKTGAFLFSRLTITNALNPNGVEYETQ